MLLNSRQPLSDEEMQRLRCYSAMTLSKEEDVERMGALIRPEPAAASPSPAASLQVVSAGKRVLLVDEDVRLIYLLTAQLDELGLPVVPATSADEAVERFEEDAFDLVLLDMSQPGAEGPELARRLKQDHDCQALIVALVTVADAETRERCIAAGPTTCCSNRSKPRHWRRCCVNGWGWQWVRLMLERSARGVRAEHGCGGNEARPISPDAVDGWRTCLLPTVRQGWLGGWR